MEDPTMKEILKAVKEAEETLEDCADFYFESARRLNEEAVKWGSHVQPRP